MPEIVSRRPSIRSLPAVEAPPRWTFPAAGVLRALSWLLAAAVALAMVAGATRWWWRTQVDPGPLPAVASLDLYSQLADLTPIGITVGGTLNAPWQTTFDELRRNHELWRMMHLENWNAVPSPLREEILDRMLAQYRGLLMNPYAWDRMTPADWDDIPQPVQTVAYRQMVAYWAGFYDVGGAYAIDRRQVRDTLQAIVMSESWFNHRAEQIDFTGNHDIGLAQASTFARARLRQLAELGAVDLSLTDEDYWNPWKATRFLAVWMSLLIDESGGNLDRAVRAYNRGIASADDAKGEAYLEAVVRRRRRFIQNHDAPSAWAWMWQRTREIEAEEWPWLRPR
jgi:hypothetical protein